MQKLKRNVSAMIAMLLASGCVTPPSRNEIDARYAAGWRPSKTYCLFGGD